MEFKINSSPHLEMSDITKRLFNRNFHSDVQFTLEDKIIYAHSLELMKRSTVFEKQLEGTMGDTKLIPISDCKYDSFLEFIRFIYTDECSINELNGIDIFKLAIKYKVVRLENIILGFGSSMSWFVKRFEHCIRDKYEIAQNSINDGAAVGYELILKSQQFLSLHPDALVELLKFERISKGVTELQIFNAVVNWITLYCKNYQLTLLEGRQRFDNLIKEIRFPSMKIDEIRECARKYPELIPESDCMLIASQAIFGGNSKNELWNSKHRQEWVYKHRHCTFKINEKCETILTVTKDMFLYGLRIGIEKGRKPIEIEIMESDVKTSDSPKLTFVQKAPNHWEDLIITLGESIRLKPNFKYTISIKYLEITDLNIILTCRYDNIHVIINDPEKAVKLIQTTLNVFELFFRSATDTS